MKILVTGGTGVIGAGAIPALLKAGHEVRLLSRGALRDAEEYPSGVEPWPADVTDESALQGAAERCDAVVHITGIVEEIPPKLTFERINVGGAAKLVREAERAGVRRFIYLSSLGADTGESPYHKSKLAAENIVRESSLDWIVLRPGNVYGPGDEVISTLLKMIRALPAVPMVGRGDQPFQPVWFEDVGEAIARACHPDFPSRRVFEIAGPDVTTPSELIEKLGAITGRKPAQLALPAWLARLGVGMAERFGGAGARWASDAGLAVPLNSDKLQMLLEGNVAKGPSGLAGDFGIEPTPLDQGLVALADALPELLPEDGVGSLERKRFWADISGSRRSPAELLGLFCDNISEVMPIEFAAEPGAPTASRQGATMTGSIPGRGNIQVRVEEQTGTSVTLATLEGHPLAGTVSFRAEPTAEGLRFTVEVHARPSNILDWIALRTVGAPMQNQNWKEVVERVVALSGGAAPEGVQKSVESLDADESAAVEKRVRDMVRRRKRSEHDGSVLEPEAAQKAAGGRRNASQAGNVPAH
jgi:NADH dehydrogenase